MKFLRKRKANKIKKLKTRVIELETENELLQEKNEGLLKSMFLYKLKCGEVKQPQKRRKTKLMGKALK